MYFINKTGVGLHTVVHISTRVQNFFIITKEAPYLLPVTSHATLLAAPSNLCFAFYLYGVAYSGHFIQMESSSM
jgi:hypothetical protein